MPQIEFLTADGRRFAVFAAAGDSVMDAALDNGVPGIKAQCGGGCTCCTCHCYIDARWQQTFPEPHADESDLLEYAWEVGPNSRLACQLPLTEAHDGLVVRLPAQQA